MKYMTFLITGSLFLAACAPAPASPHGDGHMQTTSESTRELTVQDQSDDTNIAFTVREENTVFADYGVSHTKEMHLIVVRDDLQHFAHLHPTRDDNGTWRVRYTAPAGGKYWLYADFVERNQSPHTIRFERSHDGETGTVGIAQNTEKVKTVDGYRITLETAKTGDDVSFTYKITDANGQPVEVEEYLGARGHSVLISPSGDFIHAHASDEGVNPVFITSNLSENFYRAFTQFQIKGKVITVDFDWQS